MPRPTQTMLVNTELVKAIRVTLAKRGMARQDLKDGVADVQVKTLEFLRTHLAPEGIKEWKKLCNCIAVRYANDLLRKKYRRAKYDVELCEDPDAYSGDEYVEKIWDPADHARLVELMVAQLAEANIPEVSFMILDAEAANTKHAEIAEELGISEEAVTTRLRTMRRGFRRRVDDAGLSELAPPPLRIRDVRARTGTRKR